MRKILIAASMLFAVTANAQEITGAGATFPYPVYARWASDYQKATGIKVNYQSIGSGGGLRQITARTVDFGATDKPLTPTELNQAGLVQFPTVIGGVVLVFNVPGIQSLNLTGPVIADIYLGKIKNWNDEQIQKLNPNVKIPNLPIAVVRRADGSGTTFLFADYLSKVSNEWRDKVGADVNVQWPTGLGGKGNEGVAAFVQRLNGSIGYVEFAYAKQQKLGTAKVQNKAGNFVEADDTTFAEAAAKANWVGSPGFYVILTDQPGPKSYPITGASFILLEAKPKDPKKVKNVVDFFMWAMYNGRNTALDLDFVVMPESVVKSIKAELDRIK